MQAVVQRRPFLKSAEKSCTSWGNIFSDNWKLIKILQGDWHGFDESGKFHTILVESKFHGDVKALVGVHYCDKDDEFQELDCNLIKLSCVRGQSKLLYDPKLTRWFNITSTQNENHFLVRITSGSLTNILTRQENGDDSFVSMDQINDQNCILLTHTRNSSIKFAGLRDLDSYGRFLIVLTDNENSFTLDIIEYTAERINHCKRILVSENTVRFNREGLQTDVFVDFDHDVFYLKEFHDHRKSLHGFDFSGNRLFTKDLSRLDANVWLVEQIGSSMIAVVWIHKKNLSFDLETFNMTEFGPVTWTKFTPYFYPDTAFIRPRFKTNSGRPFLCVITGSMEQKGESVFIYDILSGVEVFQHRFEYRYDTYDFNWNGFEELAILSLEDHHLYHDEYEHWFNGNEEPEKIFCIQVQNVSFKENSLKNQARLACLKSVDKTDIKGKLPGCLKNYLGIN
uniref:Uncharacterized protein n=1 Tax=Clytia hemisphaerica TaxID=252671 RepID=A0A7M5V6D8_9CNID